MIVPSTNEKQLNFKSEIEISSNKNNNFSVSFYANSYSFLEIKSIQKNDLLENSFYNKFSTDTIKENKYFYQFDDMKEICNELSERIKMKEIKLIENNDNIIIVISLPSSKIKEITFQLNKNIKTEKEQINNLTKIVFELKNEINELKTIVNNQRTEIDELKNQIKTWVDYKIEKENKKRYLSINSLIINNNKEYNRRLKEWINPNKKIKSELLYRLSRDGEEFSKFHELCDNKGPTLTLFEVEDGNKGGIYTPLSWDSNSEWKNDMETFLFNLNKNAKYKKIKNDNSIYCYNNHGPYVDYFGFYSDKMKKIHHYGSNINNYFEKGSEILPNNTSNLQKFNVKEVEIYKIIIENKN